MNDSFKPNPDYKLPEKQKEILEMEGMNHEKYLQEMPWGKGEKPTEKQIDDFYSGYFSFVAFYKRLGLRRLYGYSSGLDRIVFDNFREENKVV